MSTIGERIRWLRKERCKLTQEIVGRYVGVGKATIQKYEAGIITNFRVIFRVISCHIPFILYGVLMPNLVLPRRY